MKRKSKRSKAEEKNGVESQSDSETQSPKKRKALARKKGSKLPEEIPSETEDNDEQSEGSTADVNEFQVEKILKEKNVQGVKHYLIRWKGYEADSDTWEPVDSLNCTEAIEEFNNKKKSKKSQNKASNETETEDEEGDFEVGRIIDVYYKKDGKKEFLVSWKGYKPSENSWEPEENLNCQDLIKKFLDKCEKARGATPKELRVKRTATDRFTLSTHDTGRRLSRRLDKKQRVQYHDAE